MTWYWWLTIGLFAGAFILLIALTIWQYISEYQENKKLDEDLEKKIKTRRK